jgi:hypothetical protein
LIIRIKARVEFLSGLAPSGRPNPEEIHSVFIYILKKKKRAHLSWLAQFEPALYRDPEAQYSGPFAFCENKEKLGLGGA